MTPTIKKITMTPTPLRNPATLEEYTAYKALKEDRISITGYESPARQFNLVARIGSIYEAIDLVLGTGDVDTLARTLKNFELEPEVKTALEERVLAGTIELGKTGDSYYTKYGPTPKLLAATRGHTPYFPQIIEEIAKFLLHDKHSPLPEHQVGGQLHSENVQAGIELLLGIGKSPAEVADELAEAVKGKRGSFHTITRYMKGVRPNEKNHDPARTGEVYKKLDMLLPELLTPELLEDALRQIKLSPEEFKQEGPVTHRRHYNHLKQMVDKVRDGSYEQFSDLKDGHPTEERESYLKSVTTRIKWVESDLDGEYGSVDALVKSFQEEHLSPLVTVLQDLETNLGRDEFIARRYTKIQEQIDGVVQEVNDWQTYIKTELPLIKERLEEICVQSRAAEKEEKRLKSEPFKRLGVFVVGCALAGGISGIGLTSIGVKDYSTRFPIEVLMGIATGYVLSRPVYNYIRDKVTGKNKS